MALTLTLPCDPVPFAVTARVLLGYFYVMIIDHQPAIDPNTHPASKVRFISYIFIPLGYACLPEAGTAPLVAS